MDWIPAFLILISTVATGKKKAWGWLVGALGSLIFVFITAHKGLYGMVFMNAVFVIISCINYLKWTSTGYKNYRVRVRDAGEGPIKEYVSNKD